MIFRTPELYAARVWELVSFPLLRGPDAADQMTLCAIDHISWRPSTCVRVLLSTPDIGLKAVSLSVWRLQSFVNLSASPGIEVFVGQCRLNNIISEYNTKLLTKHEKYCNILCGIYIEIPTFSSNSCCCAIFISQ